MRRRATITIVGSFVLILLLLLGWVAYSTEFFAVINGKIRSGAQTYRGEALAPQPVPQSGWESVTIGERTVDIAGMLSPERVSELWLPVETVAAENSWGAWGYVVDADTGQVLLSADANTPHTPASTMKVFTGLEALATLDQNATLETGTSLVGADLYLWGEGDLLLGVEAGTSNINGRAGLADLADETVAELNARGLSAVRLFYQDSLFPGEKRSPAWEEQEVTEFAGDVTAFAIDTGRVAPDAWAFVDDSALGVADVFAAHLRGRGIEVTSVSPGTIPLDDNQKEVESERLAAVESATVMEQVSEMLSHSDNTLAEQYCHLSAAETGTLATFPGSAEHLVQNLAAAGIDTSGMVVNDCSGLDENSRVTATQLVQALEVSAAEGSLTHSLMRLFPRAGISGTLTNRLDFDPAWGNAQAKTGSLGKTSTLAGVLTTTSGQTLLYAVGFDDVPDGGAYLTRVFIDEFVGGLIAGG